jgi:DNA-binding transcriptional ArsR family regulator
MKLEEIVSSARFFKLMGNPTRIALAHQLSKGDAKLGKLSELLGRSKSSLCMYLGNLCEAGIVEKLGTGAGRTYSLKARKVLEVLSLCCSFCKSLDETRN